MVVAVVWYRVGRVKVLAFLGPVCLAQALVGHGLAPVVGPAILVRVDRVAQASLALASLAVQDFQGVAAQVAVPTSAHSS
jgi:hypothetical protein